MGDIKKMYIVRDPSGTCVIICTRKEDTEAFLTGPESVGYTCEEKLPTTKLPLEVHDYKMGWRDDAWLVTACSDNRGNGKQWCRAELEPYINGLFKHSLIRTKIHTLLKQRIWLSASLKKWGRSEG